MGPNCRLHLFAIRELDFNVLRLAVTHDVHGDGTPGRRLPHQTLELLLALNRSAIESNDHVVFFEARLAGRRVLINLNNLHAPIVLQLERLNAFGAYIGNTYTQIRPACCAFKCDRDWRREAPNCRRLLRN